MRRSGLCRQASAYARQCYEANAEQQEAGWLRNPRDHPNLIALGRGIEDQRRSGRSDSDEVSDQWSAWRLESAELIAGVVRQWVIGVNAAQARQSRLDRSFVLNPRNNRAGQ